MKRFLIIALVAGCGSFEDPSIVIDTRVLAMTSEPPEQVFDFDPDNPPDEVEELGLVDATVCALVSDPEETRGVEWIMTVCAPAADARCEGHGPRPMFELGRGHLDDPETAATPQAACATLPADAGLLVVLQDALMRDAYHGFSGIDLMVQLEILPDGLDEEESLFAEKKVRYAARLPSDRVANLNPTIDRLDIEVEDADPIELPLGRCADQPEPIRIAAGEELPLIPVETDGAREDYVVPTFDGGSRAFTETLSYQWLASDGSWTRGSTGGPRDISGADPPLRTRWVTPDPEDVTEELDVSLWVIQRDERLGLRWYESCVRVTPPAE